MSALCMAPNEALHNKSNLSLTIYLTLAYTATIDNIIIINNLGLSKQAKERIKRKQEKCAFAPFTDFGIFAIIMA